MLAFLVIYFSHIIPKYNIKMFKHCPDVDPIMLLFLIQMRPITIFSATAALCTLALNNVNMKEYYSFFELYNNPFLGSTMVYCSQPQKLNNFDSNYAYILGKLYGLNHLILMLPI